MNNLERVVILDDGETWGGPNIVVEYVEDKLTEEARDILQRCSEIEQVVDNIQDEKSKGNNAGRLLDINALVELYDAVRTCPDDLVLTPEIWEALNKVDKT